MRKKADKKPKTAIEKAESGMRYWYARAGMVAGALSHFERHQRDYERLTAG